MPSARLTQPEAVRISLRGADPTIQYTTSEVREKNTPSKSLIGQMQLELYSLCDSVMC